MECGICYNSVPEENFKVFECNHSICKCCFSKLLSYTCPFCREPIPSYFDQLLPSNEDIDFFSENNIEEFEPIIRLSNRRRFPNLNTQNNVNNNTYINVSIEEMEQITQQISNEVDNDNIINIINHSIPDKNKQIRRSKRNRWRESRGHQGNFMINF
tara:strand:+ start:552 stop:1022 length:471 start_codon:yes stop_codon:yes gene_type:complete